MNATVPEVVTGELVPTEQRTLFQTNDPVEVLDHARRMADALKTALDQGGMTMRFGKSEHVLIDGWQTLGSMLGVSPHIVWSRRLESLDGWEARAEARTVDGRTVGSAEAMVTRDERNWHTADEYALRSMAQTRAMSKALRGPLGFVITLAGVSATPAEEMPPEAAQGAQTWAPEWAADVSGNERAMELIELSLGALLQDAETPNPAEATVAILRGVSGYCDGQIPAVVGRLIRLHAQAVGVLPGPPVPDPDERPEELPVEPEK